MLFMFVFVMLSCLFIAALWSPERKELTSWLLFVMFIVILLLSHLVSWDRRGSWLYRFLILAVFFYFKSIGYRLKSNHKNCLPKHILSVLHLWFSLALNICES